MTALEEMFHQARKTTNRAIDDLAISAIEDSENFKQAVQKLQDFKWKTASGLSSFMIDSAIDKVREAALLSSTKNTAE